MLGLSRDSGLIGYLMDAPVDIISVLIFVATIVLMYKYKKSPFVVLIIMGCIGAVLGI